MKGWKTSSNRKVHQRALNSVIKSLNKSIERDDLWRGRFFVRQVSAQWVRYEDGSGYSLHVVLKCCDRKTRQEWFFRGDSNSLAWGGGYRIWREMNDFIIERVKVWDNDDPRKDKYDWIKDIEHRDVYVPKKRKRGCYGT